MTKLPSQPEQQRAELRRLLVNRFGLHSAFFLHVCVPRNCTGALLALAEEYRRLTLLMRPPEARPPSDTPASEGFYFLQPLDQEFRARLIDHCNKLCAL